MEIEYLEAKRNLDDRSMNQRVWSRFEWAAVTCAREHGEHGDGVKIVELGAGSGGMVERLESWGLLKVMDEHAPGGLLYATITFDGESFFEPEIDADLDEEVRRIYRTSMVRGNGGETGFGRKLLCRLGNAGFLIDEAGGSDWVVVPHNGEYRSGEESVVRAILEMVSTALTGVIDPEAGHRWSRERRAQLERKELIYVAHQLDLLARRAVI